MQGTIYSASTWSLPQISLIFFLSLPTNGIVKHIIVIDWFCIVLLFPRRTIQIQPLIIAQPEWSDQLTNGSECIIMLRKFVFAILEFWKRDNFGRVTNFLVSQKASERNVEKCVRQILSNALDILMPINIMTIPYFWLCWS